MLAMDCDIFDLRTCAIELGSEPMSVSVPVPAPVPVPTPAPLRAPGVRVREGSMEEEVSIMGAELIAKIVLTRGDR